MRDTRRFAVLLAALGLMALALTACGGGGETEPAESTAPPSPTIAATMTPEERAEAEALLKAAALQPEDVPEGLSLKDEGFATGEELAEVGDLLVDMFYSGGGASLEDRFNSMGLVLGYHANYEADAPTDPSSFSGTVSFNISVTLYRGSPGAHADLGLLPDETAMREATQEFYESAGMELKDLSVSSLAFAEVGDDRFALEMKTTVDVPGIETDIHFVLQWVSVQRDRLFGSLMMSTINASPPVEELEDLARKLDERMKAALE